MKPTIIILKETDPGYKFPLHPPIVLPKWPVHPIGPIIVPKFPVQPPSPAAIPGGGGVGL